MRAGKTGMLCLIVAEAAIFTIFVVAYIFYLGKSLVGPSPREILEVPVWDTVCLLSSSATIHWAVAALRRGALGSFRLWWAATLALGLEFIAGTAAGWHRMIYGRGFTIQTSLFGTSYYALVGLHASHVIVGLAALAFVLWFALRDQVDQRQAERCEALSYYWHFVDAVWAVVFSVVYVIGR